MDPTANSKKHGQSSHPDNYQGGSGKSFEQEFLITVDGDYDMKHLRKYLYEATEEHAEKSVPFVKDLKFQILEVRTFI